MKLLVNKKVFIPFVLILLVKVILAGFFSSDYQNKMFEPFACDFLKGLCEGRFNPWQTYYDTGLAIHFPYPIIMLLLTSVGGILGGVDNLPLFVHNVFFKLPLFLADFLMMFYLVKMFPNKINRCLWCYFASPIVIYACYMHGQLDLIPMSLTFASLYFVTGVNDKRRFVISAVVLGLAVLSKLHILAIIPLVLIYIHRIYGYKRCFQYATIVLSMVLVGVFPFWGDGFVTGVLFNKEQQTLLALYFPYGGLNLYLSLVAIFAIYAYISCLNIFNRDLLLGFCGLIFSVFLALCVPMPGWYVWIIPFIAYFMTKGSQNLSALTCFTALQSFYLVYFVFCHYKANVTDLYLLQTSLVFLKVHNDIVRNICFTFLTSSLICFILIIFRYYIAGSGIFKFRHKAFVIGICGDSGSGKSTLQNSFSQLFRENVLLRIEGDGDHKWERNSKHWLHYTHLNPKANYLYQQSQDVAKLKNGHSVHRVDYDHAKGKFTEQFVLYPKRFISISGLHTLYLPQQRENIDLKIFMETSSELRVKWKMQRDSGERGYSEAEIVEQIRKRQDDAAKYISPQSKNADICICLGKDPVNSEIGIRFRIGTSFDVEKIVSLLSELGVGITHEFSEDYNYQIVDYIPSKNNIDHKINFEKIANIVMPNRFDITNEKFKVADVADAIVKLIMLKAISDKIDQS